MAKKDKEPPKYPDLGARLAQFVEQSGEPSARQFALKAGITPAVLSNLTLGYSIPGGETLAAIAMAYPKFDLTWLLTGNETRRSPAASAPAPRPIELTQDEHRRELVATAENVLLRQLLVSKDELINELRGKPNDSTDAADYLEVAPTPQGPRAGAYLPLPRLRVQGLRRYQE